MTSNQIKINGFPFIDLLELDIQVCVNEHPTAFARGHLSQEDAKQFLHKISSGNQLSMTAKDHNNAEHIMFQGVLKDISCSTLNEVSTITVSGLGNSSLCDLRKEIRVFQDKSMSYEELTKCLTSQPDTNIIVPDASGDHIGRMLVQYNETDWEFAKRVASRIGTVVVPDYMLDFPTLSIGMPRTGRSFEETAAEFWIVKDLSSYRDLKENGVKSVSENEMTGVQFKSREIYNLCDRVVLNGDAKYVYSRGVTLVGSELISMYLLREKEGFRTRELFNMQIIGASLAGTVEKIEEDQVQVSLAYDEGSRKRWFAYSTPYSSPDGTGWYFMPETGDEIRLRFPSQIESDAYVVSSTHITHGDRSDPTVKFIRTKRGQAITFYPDSIQITDGNGSSIHMDKKKGIELKTNKGIKMEATDDIEIAGRSAISVEGQKGVQIRQNDSLILVDETIDITAAHVRVQ